MASSQNHKLFDNPSLTSLVLLGMAFILAGLADSRPTIENIPSVQSENGLRHNNLNVSAETYVLKAITSVPLYRIVGYFTNQTEENEAKVRDLGIPYDMYYTHMYLAWKSADHFMSSVSLRYDDSRSPLNGANLVLSTSSLTEMYAPGMITQVLEFVTRCYEWARPQGTRFGENRAYISVLRAASTPEINMALINRVTEQFLRSTTAGSYHLVWESKNRTGEFMEHLNYTRLICGNTKQYDNPCDWVDIGLSPDAAEDQCLYRLINQIPSEMEKYHK